MAYKVMGIKLVRCVILIFENWTTGFFVGIMKNCFILCFKDYMFSLFYMHVKKINEI